MKKVIISLLFISLVFNTSCDNTLDLKPEDSLLPEIIFSNETQAKSALQGMYSSCQHSDALSGTFDAITEWQCDNVNFVGSFPTFQDIRDYSTLSDNNSISALWLRHYRVINQANMIIKNVPTSPDANFAQSDRDDMVGQALFIRALMHFRLSNIFGVQYKQNVSGLSVPYITEPFNGVAIFHSRKSINDVYKLIEKDLNLSIIYIKNLNKSQASVAASKALLARMYLYQDKWADAANAANDVIATSGISLATDFSFYNNDSSEHIFQLRNIAVDGATAQSYSGLFNGTQFGGRGDCPFSQNLKDLFLINPLDLRYSTLKRNGTNALAAVDLFTNKYPDGVANTDDPNIFRVSEMYLIRCEANLRNSSSIGDSPVNDINKTRVRAGLSNLSTVNLNEILDERRKEFCFEGLRRMDLLRNNLPLRSALMPNSSVSLPTSNKVVFPIPQRDLDINPNLVQNIGY